MKIKIEDILKLDCRIPEQKEFLSDKFKKIPYIEKNIDNIKKDKNLIKDITEEILENKGFTYNTLTHHERRYYTAAVYDKKYRDTKGNTKLYTLYAIDKKEIYIKLCVFAYYIRKFQENKKEQNQ